VRRELFREAVVYAQWIIADKDRKKAFRKSLPKRKQRKVYQAAIQLYMSKQGDKQWVRKQLAVKSMVRAQKMDIVVKGVRVLGTGETVMRVVHGKWSMVNEQQGAWRVLWAMRTDTTKQVVEHRGKKDCLMAWQT
jgi:hypothetical protein